VSSDRLSFDPKLRDAGVPKNIPSMPIGTVDELEELGLNLSHFGSCAVPNKAGGIRGCSEAPRCPLSCKFKKFKDGGGPRRVGWERIFRGQPIRRMDGECWDLSRDKVFVEDNGGAVRIVANEGESYKKLTGVAVKTFVDATGEVQKVLAKQGEYHLPNVQREDMVIDILVKPFVRPSENPVIATDVITATVLREESARIQAESVGRALGLAGAGAPLDKRNKRAGEGKGES
jgi:hypothetical protein